MDHQTSPKLPKMTIQIVPDPNPWDDPDVLPRLRLPGLVLLALMLVACAVYPALNTPAPLLTLLMLGVCVAAQLVFVRSVGAGVLSFAVFACGSLSGSLSGGVFALCLLTSLGLGAFLITLVRSHWLVVLPAAAYLIAFLVCGDAVSALMALITVPAAGLLAYTTMKNSGRVGVICATSFMLGLCATLALAIAYNRSYGELSMQALFELIAAVREEIIVQLQQSSYMDTLREYIDAQNLTEQIDAAALIRMATEFIFNVLPAMYVLTFNLVALAAQLLCNRAYAGSGMPSLATRTSRLFVMSVPSAVIYIVCGTVSLFTAGSTPTTAVMLNLALILLPPMCIVGFFKTVSDLRSSASPLILVLLIAGVLCAPGALILCLAFSGALTTLIRPFLARMLLKDKDDPSA